MKLKKKILVIIFAIAMSIGSISNTYAATICIRGSVECGGGGFTFATCGTANQVFSDIMFLYDWWC